MRLPSGVEITDVSVGSGPLCQKGKRVNGVARTITFPPGAVPGLEELLDKWEALRGETTAASYFAFAHERRTAFEPSAFSISLDISPCMKVRLSSPEIRMMQRSLS